MSTVGVCTAKQWNLYSTVEQEKAPLVTDNNSSKKIGTLINNKLMVRGEAGGHIFEKHMPDSVNHQPP